MSQYPDARFLVSAAAVQQFPPDEGSEVAFVGRSNAGKSSAINVIVNRRQFARTSKTPGRTQLVNFFALSAGRRLVDLPGYGFARVSGEMRARWGVLLTRYFEERRSLKGVILIADVRRRLTDFDGEMLLLAEAAAVPVHILLTKADKLKGGQARQALAAVENALGARAGAQLFSAANRQGVDEARVALGRLLAS